MSLETWVHETLQQSHEGKPCTAIALVLVVAGEPTECLTQRFGGGGSPDRLIAKFRSRAASIGVGGRQGKDHKDFWLYAYYGADTEPGDRYRMSKLCGDCREEKPYPKFTRSAKANDGLMGKCSECNSESTKLSEWQKKGLDITRQEFRRLQLDQGERCAICGKSVKDYRGPHLDHDDTTEPKTIRGILCVNCNVGIGNFHHQPELLRAAIEYVERHRTDPHGHHRALLHRR